MRTTGSVWARVADYVCAWVFRSGGPPLPRRQRGRELCTRRPSAPVQSATRGTARTCFAANRVQGTPMCACRSARLKQIAEARAHWVGSAYRSSRLGLALRFLRRLHGGACDRQEVSAQASEQPHTSPNGRRGLDDGPIGCGALGVPCRAGFIGPGVSLLDPCSATKRTACTPLSGCTAWARGVCVASTRTRPHGVLRLCGTDRPMVPVHAYTYMHTHVHCMCVRHWPGWLLSAAARKASALYMRHGRTASASGRAAPYRGSR